MSVTLKVIDAVTRELFWQATGRDKARAASNLIFEVGNALEEDGLAIELNSGKDLKEYCDAIGAKIVIAQ